MAGEGNTYVATVVRDDFFNDPFFKGWWVICYKSISNRIWLKIEGKGVRESIGG
jgi:hypothetical protein